jgi:hypothetical protein
MHIYCGCSGLELHMLGVPKLDQCQNGYGDVASLKKIQGAQDKSCGSSLSHNLLSTLRHPQAS